jgi:ATP-dependent 26S proteasome regulatory subunit
VTPSAELKMAFNQAKDRQRILQEDPEVTGAWFRLVDETHCVVETMEGLDIARKCAKRIQRHLLDQIRAQHM